MHCFTLGSLETNLSTIYVILLYDFKVADKQSAVRRIVKYIIITCSPCLTLECLLDSLLSWEL